MPKKNFFNSKKLIAYLKKAGIKYEIIPEIKMTPGMKRRGKAFLRDITRFIDRKRKLEKRTSKKVIHFGGTLAAIP